MKTRNLTLATFILGALVATFAACSAQSDGTPPRQGDGSGNTTSSGGGGTVISGAGAGTVISGAGAGNPAGGASPGAGAQGIAGTTVIAGGGAGTVVGTGGAPAKGTCVVAAGTATALPIDDLEDGDNTIEAVGNRIGYWYTYNDATATGTQTPKPDPTGVIPFKPTAGGHSPLFSAETNGAGFTTWGAGMGFDFNNTAMKSCVYNASAYSGITFWAKGNVSLKAMVKIPATTQSTSDSGTCTTIGPPNMCEDHYTLTPTPALTTTWTQYTITFASTATFAQAGWGVPVPFDKGNIIAMQFQVGTTAFDYSIDDIAFF